MSTRGKVASRKKVATKRRYKRKRPYFDQAAADRVVQFIEKFCTHVNGDFAGKPIEVLPYWKEFIYKTFGQKKPNGKD